ncbi:hypothetical protein RchiOBHm_Chr2g0169901 [Rosa chinensis]|uniref:Uncharacterized protein n=1 Tax=Rosa chinensis TaxID=74649 RepID=A0A2P6S503_ROSCH|nr:hypothetical protein RchiOBHm_Chr2g0169901 [Rosa chinensis]
MESRFWTFVDMASGWVEFPPCTCIARCFLEEEEKSGFTGEGKSCLMVWVVG